MKLTFPPDENCKLELSASNSIGSSVNDGDGRRKEREASRQKSNGRKEEEAKAEL